MVKARASVGTVADVRYSFTSPFVSGAMSQARQARAIESSPLDAVGEQRKIDHRAFVCGAVMQSVAAIESECWEIIRHGPSHHKGSSSDNGEAVAFLAPLADVLDRQRILDRYDSLLHLLKMPALQRGEQPCQDMQMVISLRNELVHFKSQWGEEMEGVKLFNGLKSKKFSKAPWVQEHGVNFFPHQCLCADCAEWAAQTAMGFIDYVFGRLSIDSPLHGNRQFMKTN